MRSQRLCTCGGTTDSRDTPRCYLYRYADGVDARLPCGVSTHPGVYRHTRRFLAYRGLMLAFTKGETILLPDNWLKAIGNAYLSPTFGWGLMVAGIGISGYVSTDSAPHRLQYGNPEQSSLLMFLVKIVGVSALIVAFVAVMNAHKGVPFPVCILFGLAFVFHSSRTTRVSDVMSTQLAAMRRRRTSLESTSGALRYACLQTMGALMAIAGVVMTARVGSASPEAGRFAGVRRYRCVCYRRCEFNGWTRERLRCDFRGIRQESLNNGMSMANMDASWQDIIKAWCLLQRSVLTWHHDDDSRKKIDYLCFFKPLSPKIPLFITTV